MGKRRTVSGAGRMNDRCRLTAASSADGTQHVVRTGRLAASAGSRPAAGMRTHNDPPTARQEGRPLARFAGDRTEPWYRAADRRR
jgi:hypothetical protein